ncbi:MAG: MATE family efflux transporter [Trueperaceae bacterium]|nr:MATE family efflux transporter [Trueperaceae bacterium]
MRSSLRQNYFKLGMLKEVAILAGPLVLQQLSFTLMGVTDTYFVSRVSTEAVAAVGLAGVVFFAIMLLFRSTANSSVVFVGRSYGAKDPDGVGRAVWNVLTMVALLSCLTFFLPWLFAFVFAFAAPADSEVLRELGTQYLRIRAFEVPLAMFSAVVWGFLVGRGDSRTPMLLAWLQVGTNIFLDWLLVPGNLGLPPYGVAGAAYATVAANFINALLSAYILWHPQNRLDYKTAKFHRASLKDLRNVLKVGLPMGVGDFVEVSSFSAFFALIGRLGTDTLAANNIALQYMSMSFTLGVAVAMACSSLVSQHLGAKKPELAEQVGYHATLLAMLIMGTVGLTYLIAPASFIGVFSQDASVISAGVIILRLVAFYQIFDAIAIVLGGALNGAGDTTYTMMVRLIFAWGLFLPSAWLLAFPLEGGIRGAWIGALLYLSSLGIMYFFRFRSGRWKRIQLA